MSLTTSTTDCETTLAQNVQGKTVLLRILATTDIHMQLLGYDYVTDQPTATKGLAGIATLISEARAEAQAQNAGCILLDNGDMFQGSIIGEILAGTPVTQAHPLVASVNALRYDAIGLGNHDLDFGLTYLRDISAQLAMPLISTNLNLHAKSFIQNSALIDCRMPPEEEKDGPLKAGIVSILPAKTAIWNRHVLDGQADIADPIPCLTAAIKDLRARGAQVIILLAHMGIGNGDPDQNDSALSFAEFPGVDAIVAGHTHRRFPGQDHEGRCGVDASNGTLAERPAIMPGNAGSDLAVLDLTLSKSATGLWQVTGHTSKLRSNNSTIATDPKIKAICLPAHHAARDILSERIGHTDIALHNYFSLAMPTQIAALTAHAKIRVVRRALAGTPDADTPVLASVAAHTAGGRGGPDHYLCIQKGSIFRRHIAGLSPYANQIWAVQITGATLRVWLESTASVFNTLAPGNADQPLLNTQIPAFNFDTVFGVTYKIDPTQPAGNRISMLRFEGRSIAPTDCFILATNQFRAAGGGGIPATDQNDIILRSSVSVADALVDVIAHPNPAPTQNNVPWSFECAAPQVQATLHTSPSALNCLDDAAHLKPKSLGLTPDGFAKLRLTL